MSTLNENILKVKETFEDIASAIEEKGVEISPCDSPMVYGDRIRSIVEQVVFDPEKIYAEAYDIDEPQPTVEVMKSEDNGAIFIFGLRKGAPGKDGITPQLKIEDGYWYVSYDNGSTWTRLSKATGEDGAPGRDGQDGEDGQPGAPGEDGKDGKDGIAPQIKIENDYWWISYDEGQTRLSSTRQSVKTERTEKTVSLARMERTATLSSRALTLRTLTTSS